jgi:hypothetical protein
VAAEDEVAVGREMLTTQRGVLGDTADRLGESGAKGGRTDDAGDRDRTAGAYQPHTRRQRVPSSQAEVQ